MLRSENCSQAEPRKFWMTMQPHYNPSQLRALRTAMSSESMLEILRRDWPYLSRAGRVLKDCQAARVHPRDGHQFVIEYRLRVADEKAETIQRVFGELVG